MRTIAAALLIAVAATGCATEMVEQDATARCAKQGKTAFIADPVHHGIPLVIESASAMVVCVGPGDVQHLPAKFGADAVSVANLGGVGIVAVLPGGAAEKAGLRPNDIVTEFGGAPVVHALELDAAIEHAAAGERTPVKLRRSSKELGVTVQF